MEEDFTRSSTYDAPTTIGTEIAFITNPDQSFWSHVRITYRAVIYIYKSIKKSFCAVVLSIRTISHRTSRIIGQ